MRAIWLAKKNELWFLIRDVSAAYGGDNETWLREYTMDVIAAHEADLAPALACFYELMASAPKLPKVTAPVLDDKVPCCSRCGYRPPFCYYVDTGKCSLTHVPCGTLEGKKSE